MGTLVRWSSGDQEPGALITSITSGRVYHSEYLGLERGSERLARISRDRGISLACSKIRALSAGPCPYTEMACDPPHLG